jgi:hypothetical protein
MGEGDAVPGAVNDAADASPHPGSHHGSAKTAGGDDAETERLGESRIGEITKDQITTLDRLPGSADPLEIGATRDSPGAGELHRSTTRTLSGSGGKNHPAGTADHCP